MPFAIATGLESIRAQFVCHQLTIRIITAISKFEIFQESSSGEALADLAIATANLL